MPCYQYGRFLRECVDSILSQGIGDIRVLIIDNASTDNSLEVARQLAAEDGRIEILARPCNLGPHASWNEGIDWAKSDYLVILAADDLLADGAIARAVSVLNIASECESFHGKGRKFQRRRGASGCRSVSCQIGVADRARP